MHHPIARGMVAGLIATVVLSILMLMKQAMGIMPKLNVIAMLADMTQTGAAVGWIMHFVIGVVLWGGGFALLVDRLPGGSVPVKGIVFAVAAWLLMMIVVMPMAGAGFFGMSLGIMAPIATLMLHIIFGWVLGFSYHKLTPA
jgi:hypothetical protein